MRVARCYYTSKIFHVMVQGIRRERIFNENYLKEKFIDLSKEISNENNVSILAYCVMNNHAHILVYTEDVGNLSKMMHSLNMRYANKYNKLKHRCGYVFRNRYRCENITTIDYLKNCIRYIHNNPVKAKICATCSDYLYSSYNEYVENRFDMEIIKKIIGEEIQFLFQTRVNDNEEFLEVENEFEENPNLTVESVVNEYCIENGISRENMSLKEMMPLIKLLVNEYNISKVEIQNIFKISKYMTYKLLE